MEMSDIRDRLVDKLRIEDKSIFRELLAECIGTFFLVFIGTSANVQAWAADGGNSTSAHIAWGIGFMFAVYLAASVSGAHLNPAISFAQFLLGNIALPKVFVYSIAQLVGAYLGAALTYFGHINDIYAKVGDERSVYGPNPSGGLFATYPPTEPTDKMWWWGSLLDQIIGTAILSGLVCLITDKRHQIPPGLVPPLAGSIMTMIAMTYGANGGFAINPARDLGPRLFILCAGYGWESFSAHSYYFWIPLVGPMIGSVFGAWIYKLFVGLHGLNETVEITHSVPVAKGYNIYTTQGDETLIGFNSLSR